MKLSKKAFDVLVALAEAEGALSQRRIGERTGLSPSTVNRQLKELTESGFAKDGAITKRGIDALEPYAVKRAVFLAAGVGSRLLPITLNTPKPLVRVHGKQMLDGLIEACCSIGIAEIYVVRGYLAEQFDQLKYKYPAIRFIENPVYNETNNISSALAARDLLQNAYVFESDLILHNPKVLTKYHYSSDFLGVKVARSDDWCFTVKDGIITEEKFGGLDCYQMVGISYWDADSGKKLAEHIEAAYAMPGGKERFWEQVPLSVFPKQYSVAIRPCELADVSEIDTLRELKQIDKTYDI